MGFDGSHRRKGTKVRAVGTARGVPVGVEGTSARKHEATVLAQVLRAVRVGRRTRPKAVAGDGADDRRPVRTERRRRGLRACIPENPRNRRGSRRGRPHCFDRDGYRVLWGDVERFLAWRKGGFRRWRVRYERLLATFRAFVDLAGFLITWRILR